MFVARAKRTYGALVALLAGILFIPAMTLRDELPAVAQGFTIVGIAGVVIGLLIAFRPPRLVVADSDGATFYSRLFLGRREWQCRWAGVDSVHGERRTLAGPDGPAEAHLIFLRLSAPASAPRGLGELAGLTAAQLPELQDPHMVIWALPPPAVSVNDIGTQLAACLEQARNQQPPAPAPR